MKKSQLSPQMRIFRLKILQQIFEHFQQMTQWNVENTDNTAKYAIMAEALIEVLEVEDCGSVGGFDDENPVDDGATSYNLYNRFLAVLYKYNTSSDIEKECYFDVETLGDYFTEIADLREKYNG